MTYRQLTQEEQDYIVNKVKSGSALVDIRKGKGYSLCLIYRVLGDHGISKADVAKYREKQKIIEQEEAERQRRIRRRNQAEEMISKRIGFLEVLEIERADYTKTVWENVWFRCRCHGEYFDPITSKNILCENIITRSFVTLSNGQKSTSKPSSCGCMSITKKQSRASYCRRRGVKPSELLKSRVSTTKDRVIRP